MSSQPRTRIPQPGNGFGELATDPIQAANSGRGRLRIGKHAQRSIRRSTAIAHSIQRRGGVLTHGPNGRHIGLTELPRRRFGQPIRLQPQPIRQLRRTFQQIDTNGPSIDQIQRERFTDQKFGISHAPNATPTH
ncbi:hypothetical protein JMUB6875_47320 [Nocardia sp. JMUB6875]